MDNNGRKGVASIVNHTLKTMVCDRIGREVSLVEERVYPADIIPDAGSVMYLVKNRKCTCGIDCNVAGFACRWSGLNPDYDPFSG